MVSWVVLGITVEVKYFLDVIVNRVIGYLVKKTFKLSSNLRFKYNFTENIPGVVPPHPRLTVGPYSPPLQSILDPPLVKFSL